MQQCTTLEALGGTDTVWTRQSWLVQARVGVSNPSCPHCTCQTAQLYATWPALCTPDSAQFLATPSLCNIT